MELAHRACVLYECGWRPDQPERDTPPSQQEIMRERATGDAFQLIQGAGVSDSAPLGAILFLRRSRQPGVVNVP